MLHEQFCPLPMAGTFVRGPSPPDRQYEPAHTYEFVALRRVLQPSLAKITDRVVAGAQAADTRSRQCGGEIADTLRRLPRPVLKGLADRSPDVMIPFVRTCATFLAPLQLLGDLECVRVYQSALDGEHARAAYRPGASAEPPPEAGFTPRYVGRTGAIVRYLDLLRQPEHPRSAVLISNARVLPDGYAEMGPEQSLGLVKLFLSLPSAARREGSLNALPCLPDTHLDWGIALLVEYSLGEQRRGEASDRESPHRRDHRRR